MDPMNKLKVLIMKRKVIDASIVVKWFIDESNSDKALKLREQFILQEIQFAIPSLMYYEVLNALKYSNQFDKIDLQTAGESLENYSFDVFTMKGDYGKKTIELAMDYDLTIYDASYIALAITLETELYTADEKIKRKLPKALKVAICNLDEII
jgi:predicted nucleic acid-binding protein